MLPASNRGAGMSLGFPDVCNTIVGPATVPIPYPNIGMNAQALGFSPFVKISGVNALNLGSKISMTSGDEAGTAHPTIKGAGSYTMGNPIVSIDKLPAIHLTCPTTGNNMNNPIGAVLVPSAVNVLMCLRADGPEGVEAPARLAEVGAALARPSVGGLELAGGDVGVISIGACGADLAASALDAIERSRDRGAVAVVLDLRGNGGGDLDAAVALAGALLPEGAIVAHVHEPDGDVVARRAHGAARGLLPLVALIDRRTASAAELIVAALSTHERAVVVGERSFGKGWAWGVRVADGGDVRADRGARWSDPSGRSVEGVGLDPDLEVPAAAALIAAVEVARELGAR